MLRIEVPDDGPRKKENHSGDAGERDQSDIDGAMQPLFAAAIEAPGEMVFIVAAHLGRDAGDVIAPAGEDVADHGVNTMHHP